MKNNLSNIILTDKSKHDTLSKAVEYLVHKQMMVFIGESPEVLTPDQTKGVDKRINDAVQINQYKTEEIVAEHIKKIKILEGTISILTTGRDNYCNETVELKGKLELATLNEDRYWKAYVRATYEVHTLNKARIISNTEIQNLEAQLEIPKYDTE